MTTTMYWPANAPGVIATQWVVPAGMVSMPRWMASAVWTAASAVVVERTCSPDRVT
ncbi:hypothetical protein [Nocardia abscessus]|uniref:hypothetical protein n=1 Tax=Nocardia abscessus TaxID=120957 RepID=UPI002456112C|nr:hypothetical protein [Nocardia abscessus]